MGLCTTLHRPPTSRSARVGVDRTLATRRAAVRTAQRPPLAVDYARVSIAIAHNGNLTNAEELREKLEARGSIFHRNGDNEFIITFWR